MDDNDFERNEVSGWVVGLLGSTDKRGVHKGHANLPVFFVLIEEKEENRNKN